MAAAAAALFVLVSHRSLVKMNHSAAYAFLGNHYVAMKDEAKAEEAFAEAYRRDPARSRRYSTTRESSASAGRDVESAGHVRGGVRSHAAVSPRSPLEYGLALERLGRPRGARRSSTSSRAPRTAMERVLACRYLARRLSRRTKGEAAQMGQAGARGIGRSGAHPDAKEHRERVTKRLSGRRQGMKTTFLARTQMPAPRTWRRVPG